MGVGKNLSEQADVSHRSRQPHRVTTSLAACSAGDERNLACYPPRHYSSSETSPNHLHRMPMRMFFICRNSCSPSMPPVRPKPLCL